MAYSTPADNPIVTEAQTPTKFLEPIFLRFFRLHKTWRKKKEKISFTFQRAISAKGGFIVPSPFLCSSYLFNPAPQQGAGLYGVSTAFPHQESAFVFDLRFRFNFKPAILSFFLPRFINHPDHIECALRVIFEFISQDSFAAI